jgi:hypothetical protein
MFQQHPGMRHQSDRTGNPVEKPVNTPQGVQNTAPHQNIRSIIDTTHAYMGPCSSAENDFDFLIARDPS